jgi:hypothetical protein
VRQQQPKPALVRSQPLAGIAEPHPRGGRTVLVHGSRRVYSAAGEKGDERIDA